MPVSNKNDVEASDKTFNKKTKVDDTRVVVISEVRFELRDKIFTVTTDNDKNMQKVVRDLKQTIENISWQPCAAHTIQLVIGEVLEPINILAGRAKR
ncbi:14613_t:CDS:2 [Racocetra persica]|uniref:14613_t:CDS:1 n=1 Tax=Racocetra persica TaxID=160502 RepID=A0ACA9PFW7_9GLOM|nr:14613_t:CDS:2 [Racocetra persica]